MRSKIATCFLALTCSCSLIKGAPPVTSDFLPYPYRLVEADPRFPFAGAWVAKKNILKPIVAQKSKIYIKPVNIQFAAEKLKESAPTEKGYERRIEDLEEVAGYLQMSFQNRFRFSETSPLELVKTPTPDSLILEIAITELVPTDTVINVLGTAGGFFVPGAGIVNNFAKGSISIEAIVRDGASKQVIMQFKDKEIDKSAPFTLKDFQEFAHARETIDDWADQYVMIMHRPWDPMVSDNLRFTLSPI